VVGSSKYGRCNFGKKCRNLLFVSGMHGRGIVCVAQSRCQSADYNGPMPPICSSENGNGHSGLPTARGIVAARRQKKAPAGACERR
jgi:hypothetical protein